MAEKSRLIERLANNKEVIFKVKVLPNAGKDEIKGETADGCLKVNLTATAIDNKANISLIKFLAQELGIRRYQVEIIKGQSDHFKTIKISR